MNPFVIKHLHVFHSSQFESLVHARRQFMTTHILIPVHHQIRFHQTVLLGLTMSRRIALQHRHTFQFDSLTEHRYITGLLLGKLTVVLDVKVIETAQFPLDISHQSVFFHLI